MGVRARCCGRRMNQTTTTSAILIVDDDPDLTNTLAQQLQAAGYRPLVAHTGEDGVALALAATPDLVLLDIMLPGVGGLAVCRQLRSHSDVPILFLTALDDIDSVVAGLEAGGDDYLVKPYQMAELLARIMAHLRRRQWDKSSQRRLIFGNGELIINLDSRQVLVHNQEVSLTPREFDLLAMLARNAGRVLTTTELLLQAWGGTPHDPKDNIKPYIHYLRKKIEADPAAPRWIVTARGVGYRFVDPI